MKFVDLRTLVADSREGEALKPEQNRGVTRACLLPVILMLAGCGHMDDILMGGAAGMAAGMGAPVYGAPAQHYPHWYEADSPSWDAADVSSAIRAQTTAIQSMNQ